MTFYVGELKFTDSFQCMASPIEHLVDNLFDETDKLQQPNMYDPELPITLAMFVPTHSLGTKVGCTS